MFKFALVKKLIPIVLLLALMLPFGAKVALVADYWMNQKQYLELCQNKDKPAMKCNGKCHLAKEMVAVNNTSPEKPEIPSNIKFEITPFIVPAYASISGFNGTLHKTNHFAFQAIFSENHLSAIFHPPC